MPDPIKERSLGEILEDAFQVYRNHLGLFLGIALCVVVPSVLLVALVNWLLTGSVDPAVLELGSTSDLGTIGGGAQAPELEQTMRGTLAVVLTAPIELLGGVVQDAAVSITVVHVYLGRNVSIRSSFQRVLPVLGPLIGASVLKGLGIMLGLLCLLVPGILLLLRWLVSTQAILIEGEGALDSLRRSRELTAGNYGHLLLLMTLLLIGGVALFAGVRLLVPDSVEQVPVLRQLLEQVPELVLTPFSSAALTLAYFDLRVKNEGFDRERLEQSLDRAAATLPQS